MSNRDGTITIALVPPTNFLYTKRRIPQPALYARTHHAPISSPNRPIHILLPTIPLRPPLLRRTLTCLTQRPRTTKATYIPSATSSHPPLTKHTFSPGLTVDTLRLSAHTTFLDALSIPDLLRRRHALCVRRVGGGFMDVCFGAGCRVCWVYQF